MRISRFANNRREMLRIIIIIRHTYWSANNIVNGLILCSYSYMLLLLDGVVSLNSFSFWFVVFCRFRTNGIGHGMRLCIYGTVSSKYVSSNQFGVCEGENPINESLNFSTRLCQQRARHQYCLNVLYRIDEWGIHNLKYHVKHVRRPILPQLSQVLMLSGKNR